MCCWDIKQTNPSYISGVHHSSSFSEFPTYICGVHLFGWDFYVCERTSRAKAKLASVGFLSTNRAVPWKRLEHRLCRNVSYRSHITQLRSFFCVPQLYLWGSPSSSSSAIDSGAGQIFSPVDATKPAVW